MYFCHFYPKIVKRLDNYILPAVNAALSAGEAIIEVYLRGPEAFGVETKSDCSPLTIADTAAHRMIVTHLEPTAIPVLSEEGADIPYGQREKWEELWIVDPLDGTKEFIKRNGEFTVNIALIRSGIPVLGVVYAPVPHTLYFAADGLGSFRADVGKGRESFGSLDELTGLSAPLPLPSERDKYCVVASKSHRNAETEEFIAALERKYGEVEVVSRGSSLKLCLVAEGAADIYPRLGPTMEWDTAAGHAVARFAGAGVRDHSTGKELVYNKKDLLNPYFVVERRRPGASLLDGE